MKKREDLYINISNSINRANVEKLKFLLLQDDLIDITQDKCDFLYLPIERDQPEVVDILLNYFFSIQLSKYDRDISSTNQKYLLIEVLKESIFDWITEYGCSVDMQQVLSNYFNLNNKSNIDVLTEISEEQSTDVETSILNTTGEVGEEYSTHIEIQTINYQDRCVFQLYNDIFDNVNNNLLNNKHRYSLNFKYLIQDLLEIKSVYEVKHLLDSLKEPLNVERVPSESTLYRWRQSIENLPKQNNSSFSQALLEASSIENLTDKSIEKVEFLLGKNTLDFSRDDNLPEPYVGLTGGTIHHEGEDF